MVGIKRPLSHRQNSEQPNKIVLKNCWSVKLLNLFSCFQGLQRLHHYRNMLFKASSSPVPLETLHLWRGHGNSNIIPLSHLLTQFYLFCPSSFSTPFQAMSKLLIQLNINISSKFFYSFFFITGRLCFPCIILKYLQVY